MTRSFKTQAALATAGLLWCGGVARATPAEYFGIHVIDADTGRGIPQVQFQTTYKTSYYTDSAGYIAFRGSRLSDSETCWRRALAHAEAAGDDRVAAGVLRSLAVAAGSRGDQSVAGELLERGIKISYGAVWSFLAAEGLTFKKNSARRRAGAPRRCPQARVLEAVSGKG